MKISLILVSTLALVGLLAGCQPHPPKPDKMIEMVTGHIQSELSLTDPQKAKFQDLVSEVKGLIKQHMEAESPFRARAEALISSPTLDTDQVRTLVHDREAGFNKDLDAALDTLLPKLAAFMDSLTPDQKKKIVDFFNKMGSAWGKTGW